MRADVNGDVNYMHMIAENRSEKVERILGQMKIAQTADYFE